MLMCRAVVPGMMQRNAAVINFGSAQRHIGVSPEVVYGCRQGAILHYTRCWRGRLRPMGARQCRQSGPTTTARFLATAHRPAMMTGIAGALCQAGGRSPMPRLPRQRQAGFVNGQVLRVDGGMTLFASEPVFILWLFRNFPCPTKIRRPRLPRPAQPRWFDNPTIPT